MILQENIFYFNGKVINLKREGKYADNKEKYPGNSWKFSGENITIV